jgi:holo-[acyl-carrier protein] synthase
MPSPRFTGNRPANNALRSFGVIVGTGIDIIEISRIAAAAKNSRFLHRVFTVNECQAGSLAPNRLAGFFAAKEALLKAMGTGLSGFSWQEMEIAHNALGAPVFQVRGKVACLLEEQGAPRIHVSISHCREYAVAQVILEK